MKKLIDRGLLIIGCLFLAWILVLLIQDVTKSYEKASATVKYETVQEEEKDTVLEKGVKGLLYIADSFIYAYNECGYFGNRISGFGTDTDGFSEIQLYLLIAFLLCVPAAAGGYIGHVYVLTGGVLGLILFLGQVPEYKYVVMLAAGWIYMHLIKSWLDRKKEGAGFMEAFQEFFVMLLPGYVIVIIMFLLLSYLLPSDSLPEADKKTKDTIFSRLQEIQLVSDQYEENQKKQMKDSLGKEDTEKESMPEETAENENAENILLESEEGFDNESMDTTQEKDPLSADGDSADEGNGSPEPSEYFEGGVSGGRTDRTGNLRFSGKPVLKVTADSKPENNLYVRLFYAENYEDNRWKETSEEQYIDPDAGEKIRENTMSVFYGLKDGGGSKNIEYDIFRLTYYENDASEISFGSSRSVENRFPEQEEYIASVCREVPAALDKMFSDQFGEIYEQGTEKLSQGQIVRKVEQILEDTAYYTLSPGDAPGQEDFITWFLTENKKGYCMHFASAGVMLLRAAGVSSRYAEGYFVPVSAWIQQEDGSWCAQVQDSNAHAWAEIYRPGEYTEDRGADEEAECAGEDIYERGCWIPVEVTPSYNGELAGSFAGQQDTYVGRMVIPAAVVQGIRAILILLCMILLIMAGRLIFRKLAAVYEYRMFHTGSRRQDIKNMMRLLQRKMIRKNRNVRKLMKTGYLTQSEFVPQVLAMIPELGEDEKASEYFSQFSNYVYKAAFGADVSEKEKRTACFLYRKLINKLTVNKKQRTK